MKFLDGLLIGLVLGGATAHTSHLIFRRVGAVTFTRAGDRCLTCAEASGAPDIGMAKAPVRVGKNPSKPPTRLDLDMTGSLTNGVIDGVKGKIAPDAPRRASLSYAIGEASWYSRESCRREGTSGITASGERFENENLTCASWDYSFGTLLRITNAKNGKSVIVRVNDRGPAKRLYRQGRIVDLSKAAFREIASLSKGIIKVKVERGREDGRARH